MFAAAGLTYGLGWVWLGATPGWLAASVAYAVATVGFALLALRFTRPELRESLRAQLKALRRSPRTPTD